MVHSPSVFQSICIRESIWTSCLHVPADFHKMRKKYTYLKWQPSCLCLGEAEALVGLNWWPENETGAQTAEAPDWTTDGIKPFPPSFLKLFLYFSAQYNKESVHLTYLRPIFLLKKIKWSDDYKACVMRSIIKNNFVLSFVCPL